MLSLILLLFLALAVGLQPDGFLPAERRMAAVRDTVDVETEVVRDTTRGKKGAVLLRDSTRVREKGEPASAPETAGRVNFTYIGALQLDSAWLADGAQGNKRSSRSSGAGAQAVPGGGNDPLQGDIPEIVLECAEDRVERVIANYGFLAVAASNRGVIGAVNRGTGELSSLTQRTLARYSTRARSFPGYGNPLIARIRHSYPELDSSVRLLFLCSREQENEVIAQQAAFADKLNVPLEEISLMEGFYDADLQVQFTRAYLKDGRVVSV